jgi:hypothetical protein
MLDTTIELVRAALRADPTVTPAERNKRIALLRNGDTTKDKPQPAEKLPAIVRPAQVAILLGRSTRSVHALCEQGLLTKAKWPGRQRAAGITQSSLTALLNASSGDVK